MDVYFGEPDVRFAKTEKQIKCVKDLSLKKNCLNICPKYDCFKQQFIQKVTSNAKEERNDSIMSLTFSTAPLITHHHKPKLETIELLCYLASILSLWFGFSMISILDCLKIIVNRVNQSNKLKIVKNKFIFSKQILMIYDQAN